ncbi:MAG: tetratricopeptide repeat protein [Pseudomonadota bacterium]
MVRARAEFEKLTALAPNDAATLNNLAWIYQIDGDPRAAALAQQAFTLAPRLTRHRRYIRLDPRSERQGR